MWLRWQKAWYSHVAGRCWVGGIIQLKLYTDKSWYNQWIDQWSATEMRGHNFIKECKLYTSHLRALIPICLIGVHCWSVSSCIVLHYIIWTVSQFRIVYTTVLTLALFFRLYVFIDQLAATKLPANSINILTTLNGTVAICSGTNLVLNSFNTCASADF